MIKQEASAVELRCDLNGETKQYPRKIEERTGYVSFGIGAVSPGITQKIIAIPQESTIHFGWKS
jgi:hypothetical protein